MPRWWRKDGELYPDNATLSPPGCHHSRVSFEQPQLNIWNMNSDTPLSPTPLLFVCQCGYPPCTWFSDFNIIVQHGCGCCSCDSTFLNFSRSKPQSFFPPLCLDVYNCENVASNSQRTYFDSDQIEMKVCIFNIFAENFKAISSSSLSFVGGIRGKGRRGGVRSKV